MTLAVYKYNPAIFVPMSMKQNDTADEKRDNAAKSYCVYVIFIAPDNT